MRLELRCVCLDPRHLPLEVCPHSVRHPAKLFRNHSSVEAALKYDVIQVKKQQAKRIHPGTHLIVFQNFW